ncbi:MAG: hypothetical protein ACI810_003004 [Gammaproteobacteria bacterium]
MQFGGHRVDILTDTDAANTALEFLFRDIHSTPVSSVDKTYLLLEKSEQWQCIVDDKCTYQSNKIEDTANYLMGEVVFHLIENNDSHLAVHAGYVSDSQGGIMIPGESGHGKSSLTFWMAQNGYQYHTDELILLESTSSKVKAFTRPFNIKNYGLDAITQLVDIELLGDKVMRGNFVHIISHRCINPDFTSETPDLTRIVFPRYSKDAPNTLTPLSKALAGIELMKSNVIARNLPGHGFDQLLSIVRSAKAYRLDYNDFAVLPELLQQLSTLENGK